MPYATYRFNKIIAAETIRFIVTVAIVVYKGLRCSLSNAYVLLGIEGLSYMLNDENKKRLLLSSLFSLSIEDISYTLCGY